MSATSKIETWAERGARLHGDHERFDERFDALCATAREGDWTDVDALWGPFEKDLRAHMAFEERELFEKFAATGEGPADVVKTLKDQHADLRKQLAQLGIETQLHAIRADSIDAFVKALRMHAAVESAHFYPWLEKELEAAAGPHPTGHGGVRSL